MVYVYSRHCSNGCGEDEIRAVQKVQKAVDDIESRCRKWRVILNGEKSKLVILSRKRKKLNENLCILLFNDPEQSSKLKSKEKGTRYGG